MDSIFTWNSENSKTSDTDRLLLNLSDKINLKRRDKYVILSNLGIYYITKVILIHYNDYKQVSKVVVYICS